MSEMASVEQQYVGGSANAEHHCKDCGLYFESDKSLEVHLRYHQDNLLSQWASQAQQEESNNNNSKAGNHNSHVATKRESVTAPADSSEPSSRPPSEGPPANQQQAGQQQQPGQQQVAQPGQQQVQSSQPQQGLQGAQQQAPSSQNYNHFQTPMFSETSYFMQNDQAYMLPHQFSPSREEAQPSNYRYHPYQHQQHFPPERANSVSSTSPRSPLQCDKCGAVYDDANQLGEHVRSSHPTSPGAYNSQAQYQQLGGSPPHQAPQQMHASPPQSNQQTQQAYDYNGAQQSGIKVEIKQEPEEQAEILDLDSHKVQTHRYEEELMRLHQQQQQEMQMQMHQQQHQHQQQQQQAVLQQHQHQQQQQRGGSHSVSSMLGWPPAQPHEYHPAGVSPMGAGPMVDNVSPIPDQGQFMRAAPHIPVEPPRHPGSPIISSTQQMAPHQIPGLLQQPPKPPPMANQSWKSNEARRPKTYNCTACNKWFTSSGHLKRHYNTTLHKNAVKQSNQPDPANMPISAHHHPGRDAASLGGGGGGRGSARSPELSSSGSPPNLMAGPSGEAARGLLHTPSTLYTSSNSSSNESSATLPQQPPSTIHLASTMVPLNSPAPSPITAHHRMGSPSASPQMPGHHLPMGSPSQMGAHPMNSPISPMGAPPPPPSHLNSPSPMGSHPHHMSSPSPIMGAPMNSPPMGGTSMPHQPYPNALPPHVTPTTNIPGLLESITSQLTTIGNELPPAQQTQEMLPGFGTFSNHQRPLPSFNQFGMSGFLVGPNQPQAVNVGGLSPEENLPQDRSFDSPGSNYDPYRSSPPRYESLANMEVMQQQQQQQQQQQSHQHQQHQQQQHHHHQHHHQQQQHQTDGMIIKQYEMPQPRQTLEANNNLPHNKEDQRNLGIGLNANINTKPPADQHGNEKEDAKKMSMITKEHQVTSTNTGSHYISQDGFHKCIECDKVFNKACYLTQHNKSFHSGDKPFKCNQCGKRFPLEYLHAEHLQKHAGDKPYKCEICPKQFNHKTDLRRHMCLHTGEKPYACDNCGKGFIRKDHMMKHLETHKKKTNSHVHLRA